MNHVTPQSPADQFEAQGPSRKATRSRRPRAVDGVLIAHPPEESYDGHRLCAVAYLATKYPSGRIDLSDSPVDYDGTHLGGIPLDSADRRWLDDEPWNPLEESHPLTGSLCFGDFEFISDTGWAWQVEADGRCGPARRIGRDWLRTQFPLAAEALWPSGANDPGPHGTR